MGAKASTEQGQRPRTFSSSEGTTHTHNNHSSGSTGVTTTPLARGSSNPFSTNGEGTRGPVRGRSYSSSAVQGHSSASGILELSGRTLASSGFWPVQGIRCPICNKTLMPDDIEVHLVMCLTRPRINYNEEVLIEAKEDECVICLEEMEAGQTIARLPCLCIYHLSCLEKWFHVSRSCPEHPS